MQKKVIFNHNLSCHLGKTHTIHLFQGCESVFFAITNKCHFIMARRKNINDETTNSVFMMRWNCPSGTVHLMTMRTTKKHTPQQQIVKKVNEAYRR